jgi:hypothetical protein
MIGQMRFPLNPIHSIDLLFIALLLGKLAQSVFGVNAVFVPFFLLFSLLDAQKASVPMLARVDRTC